MDFYVWTFTTMIWDTLALPSGKIDDAILRMLQPLLKIFQIKLGSRKPINEWP